MRNLIDLFFHSPRINLLTFFASFLGILLIELFLLAGYLHIARRIKDRFNDPRRKTHWLFCCKEKADEIFIFIVFLAVMIKTFIESAHSIFPVSV